MAPILERARQAEAQDDMVRAAWLAENALALDLECREAKEIIRRVQAHIAANPTLTEDTVDVPTGRDVDPDDTASFTRPIHTGFWDKVIAVFRGRKSSDAARRTPAGGGSDSKGHTA